MLDSVPVPLQAILWPLVGAVVVIAANRLLPHWLGRLIAAAAALASLAALWSMRGSDLARIEFPWEPLGVFRTSPILYPSELALFGGLVLASVTAASVLGIRGSNPRSVTWHGLLLVALSGSLIAMMGASLPTIAAGSALVDLALIAMAVLSTEPEGLPGKPPLSMIVTGIMSTLVLTFGALQLSTRLGTASLLAAEIPTEVVVMLGVAGLLRLMIFPLHPRRLNTPQQAVTTLLLAGMGLYLISRAQSVAPILESQQWALLLGTVALAAGGFLSWASITRPEVQEGDTLPDGTDLAEPAGGAENPRAGSWWGAGLWQGFGIQQTGLALVFLYLLGPTVPWPLFSLATALAMLTIWWDTGRERKTRPRFRWVEWMAQQVQAGAAQARAYLVQRLPKLERWQGSRIRQYLVTLFPAIALASLAGLPLTAGAVTRWPLYASVLNNGQASVLIALLAADTFLMAALWQVLPRAWKQAREQKPGIASLLAMAALAVLVFAVGLAPDRLLESLALPPLQAPKVSVWGLGLVYMLPWLIGAWLARARIQIAGHLPLLRDIVNLDWLYQAAGWAGQRLLDALRWLGLVGEGDGWWGWALIILALGAVLLASR